MCVYDNGGGPALDGCISLGTSCGVEKTHLECESNMCVAKTGGGEDLGGCQKQGDQCNLKTCSHCVTEFSCKTESIPIELNCGKPCSSDDQCTLSPPGDQSPTACVGDDCYSALYGDHSCNIGEDPDGGMGLVTVCARRPHSQE